MEYRIGTILHKLERAAKAALTMVARAGFEPTTFGL